MSHNNLESVEPRNFFIQNINFSASWTLLTGSYKFSRKFCYLYFLGLSHFNERNIPIKYNYKKEIPGIISDQAVSKFHDLY